MKILEKEKRTVLFVTHDIDEAILLSDKIELEALATEDIQTAYKLIKAGKLPPKDLASNPQVKALNRYIKESAD